MSLSEEQSKTQAKYQTHIDDVLKILYGSRLSVDEKKNYRIRIANMASDVNLAEALYQKALDVSTKEKEFIAEQVEKRTPVEQLVLYLDAPRESDVLRTRSDISKIWKKEDADFAGLSEKDFIPRAQNAMVALGSVVVAVALVSKVISVFHPRPFFENVSDSLKVFRDNAFGGLSPLNPITGGVAALVFLVPLLMRYQNQKNMTEVVFNKPYTPGPLTQHLKNSPGLQSKLDEIHPSEQVLLQHLVTPISDEKLRLFLMADDKGKRELLVRYPPPFQARIDNLFRRYHFENSTENFWGKWRPLPSRIRDVADAQWTFKETSIDGMIGRLQQRRENLQKSSSLLSLPTKPSS